MSRMFLLSLLFLHLSSVTSFWMLEELEPSSYALHPTTCSRLPGLSRRQREMCLRHAGAMRVVVKGLKSALSECSSVFENDLWNCSSRARQLTGTPAKVASRESAYIYALTAAGVSHALAKACAKGEIEECGCGPTPSAAASRKFMWSGCSDNVKYGNTFGRKFIDTDEKAAADARSLMNLHNNRVGRRLLASGMEKACKCHGVSGSCVTKTCWKVVPPLEAFARSLKRRYDDALQVTVATVPSGKLQLRATPFSPSGRTGRYVKEADADAIARNSLVFLDPSPNLCERAQEVSGRECGDSCSRLCCGRGWRTVRRLIEKNCECQFHWCCNVTCNTCTVVEERNYCN